MSSGRDRERDRRAQAASARTNEYFVPKDGIDREVITADICRYLGNDALVRPGNYENPQTRQVQAGYFITAYRNLTTAMIADLKADSERWEAERRATASRGQPSNVEYRASTTHQSRQYYGPTEAAPAAMQQYAATAATGTQQGVYDNGGAQYQPQSSYAQPATGYAQPQGYAVQDNNYYVAGADLGVDPQSRSTRIPVTQAGTVPRSNVQYSATPTYQQDNRSNYYPPQPGPVVSSTQYPQQPTDPYYGRAVPVTGAYDPQDAYVDNRQYQDPGSYSGSQAPLSSASSATATSGSQTSGTRDRDRERTDRERHHGRSRR